MCARLLKIGCTLQAPYPHPTTAGHWALKGVCVMTEREFLSQSMSSQIETTHKFIRKLVDPTSFLHPVHFIHFFLPFPALPRSSSILLDPHSPLPPADGGLACLPAWPPTFAPPTARVPVSLLMERASDREGGRAGDEVGGAAH